MSLGVRLVGKSALSSYCCLATFRRRCRPRTTKTSTSPYFNGQQQRYQSTTTTTARSLATASTSRNVDIVDLGGGSGGLTPLEFMEANSTLSSGAGTIFSDTLPVIWTSDLLCAIKDLDGKSISH
jgi:hypothetical protein